MAFLCHCNLPLANILYKTKKNGLGTSGMCLTGMHKVLGLISSITEREKKDFIEGTIVSSCNF